MQVLHVVETLDSKAGGIPFALFNIIEIEREIGVESNVLSIDTEEHTPSKENGIKFHLFSRSFPKRLTRSKLAIQWLKKNIKNFDCLVIHSTWNLLCQESARISFSNKVPYVVWPHGSLDPFDLRKKHLPKRILGRFIVRSYLKNALEVCVTSVEEKQRLNSFGSSPSISILPLPVFLSKSQGNRERFRRKYGYSDTDFVFLLLSRMNYKKGIDVLLKALELLRKENTNVQLFLAGADSNGYMKHLNKLIQRLGLEEIVKYGGMLENEFKADAFMGSDCFILPSLNENFGIVIIESLLYGLPVIISDNVYIFKEIVDNNGGWVCEANFQSVRQSMSNVLNNPEELLLKKNNAISAGERFTSNHLKDTYRKFYNLISNDNR